MFHRSKASSPIMRPERQIDFRLIVEFELLAVDRAAQFSAMTTRSSDLAIESACESGSNWPSSWRDKAQGLNHHGISLATSAIARYADTGRDVNLVTFIT